MQVPARSASDSNPAAAILNMLMGNADSFDLAVVVAHESTCFENPLDVAEMGKVIYLGRDRSIHTQERPSLR